MKSPLAAILKLCDFGFAKVDNGDLGTPQFTPYYASPQVLEAQRRYKHHSRDKSYTYSKSCDMWSLGVIIYILLCGYPPFFPSHPTRKGVDRVMKKRIQLGEFQFPREEWEMVSDNAKNLIRGLLTVEQGKIFFVDSFMVLVLDKTFSAEGPTLKIHFIIQMID